MLPISILKDISSIALVILKYPASVNWFTAGYGNTTSSINAVRFQMSSGNIGSGTIKLYGIKDS